MEKIAEAKKNDNQGSDQMLSTLVNLIIFEDSIDVTKEIFKICEEAELSIFHLKDLIELGVNQKMKNETSIKEPKAEDCFIFMYTSGTTGDPKGVKLSHRAIINRVSANKHLALQIMDADSSYLSYLPASHAFEQVIFGASMVYGMKCGFYSGAVTKIIEDM